MNEILITFEEEIEETIKGPQDFYPKDMGKEQAIAAIARMANYLDD